MAKKYYVVWEGRETGIFTDWEDVPSWEDLGYPMAECRADGSFVLTKPESTGGLVDLRSASEQLLYEIGDPSAYLLPDVTCDWRHVELSQVGADRVEVRGAIGRPPPTALKACAQMVDGYKATALLFIGGRDAERKARRLGFDFVRRAERLLDRDGFGTLRDVDIEILGAESTYGPQSRVAFLLNDLGRWLGRDLGQNLIGPHRPAATADANNDRHNEQGD